MDVLINLVGGLVAMNCGALQLISAVLFLAL